MNLSFILNYEGYVDQATILKAYQKYIGFI